VTVDQITFPFTHCRVGVSVRDITPPTGIYHTAWGAAKHDRTEGVHRPLTATAAVFSPLDADQPTLALVALDIGWFQNVQDGLALRAQVMQGSGLSEAELMLNYSHTHAGTNANSFLTDRPGGEFIKPYLAQLADAVTNVVLDARAAMVPAWIAWGYGRSTLAVNRDYWDADAKRYACGFNPHATTDDTVLVARVTDNGGRVLATMVNYSCHPTTLAWDNKLLSPDFVGATREILEHAFAAPALYLQGAQGETSPRDQYVGDTGVADRNGRILGYAAAAAIEALPPPASKFVYTGIVASGADLGTWAYQPSEAEVLRGSDRLEALIHPVDLQRKELPSSKDLEPLYNAETRRREKELILRRLLFQRALGPDPVHHMPIWIWRLGPAGVVGLPNEAYSILQVTLRERFPGRPIMVCGVTNGTVGYLPPRETYGQGRYQEQQSPYTAGCLEATIEAAADGLAQVFNGT
jgi:hypothetical protein